MPSKVFHRDANQTFGSGGEWVSYKAEGFEEEDWASQEIKTQISSTLSSIQATTLRSKEQAYFVLGLSGKQTTHEDGSKGTLHIFTKESRDLLTLLSAEILAYLSPTNDRILISCPLGDLAKLSETKSFKSPPFKPVKRFSPLFYNELVDDSLAQKGLWQDSIPIAIHIMPNISDSLVRDYLKVLIGYLAMHDDVLDWDDFGTVFVSLTGKETKKLLDDSNFIFSISEMPKGAVEKLRKKGTTKRKKNNRSRIVGIVSSVSGMSSNSLPPVCLMDTGVNPISQLKNVVIQKDGLAGFRDFDDGYMNGGHGTPVACLASLGETLNNQTARIISYKVYADNRRGLVYQGFVQAINKYSAQNVRLFTSSIVFTNPQPFATSKLNRLIQEKNTCVTFSAGNIDPQEVLRRIANGSPYPSYIQDYPVQDPARAVNVLSVGAVSKKDSTISIARKNQLSPFTRCGTKTPNLYNCPKPELVQHGGNECHNGTAVGVGVDSFDGNGNPCSFLMGTSFASPLLIHELAKIEGKYGDRIENAETLKAIALAFSKTSTFSQSKPRDSVCECLGFGETKFTGNCDWFHTLLVTEGTIPLTDKISLTNIKKNRFFKSRIRKIWIPKFVQKIEMFLVHSDNNFKTATPSLSTYLKVYAKKTGNEKSFAQLANPEEQNKKSHVKVFRWAYRRRGMEGKWRIYLVGQPTADMHPEDMSKTRIRYGCAILITAKPDEPRLYSLTQEIYNKNRHLWHKVKT